ncbi:hypothetical protein MIMGU_mgv1a016832mg [Erythranthe guttata]|uniref:Uncharacterized protein n=1 Tax=Erythranthe guttata TaxID=4155 RepID=A0A022QLS5_ERYGU|nr:hypothetical protein MIMGU_mgv1a016832mg [Erythranthe guttata]
MISIVLKIHVQTDRVQITSQLSKGSCLLVATISLGVVTLFIIFFIFSSIVIVIVIGIIIIIIIIIKRLFFMKNAAFFGTLLVHKFIIHRSFFPRHRLLGAPQFQN